MNKKIHIRKILALSAFAALLFIAVAYSWGSSWSVGNWLQNGQSVSAKDLAESLQYLYERVASDSECSDGQLLRYNQSLNKLECFSCGDGQVVKWVSGKADCGFADSSNNLIACNNIAWRKISGAASWGDAATVHIDTSGLKVAIGSINNKGLRLSTDGGNSFSLILSGSIQDVYMSYDGKYILAHNVNNGVYLSTDYGVSWNKITTLGAPRDAWLSMSGDGKYMAAAVSYGGTTGYVYLSSDFGNTWQQQSSIGYQMWHSVNIARNNPQIVLATDAVNKTVYKTTDFGNSWTKVFDFTETKYGGFGGETSVSPNGNRAITIVKDGDGWGWTTYVFKSEDGGNTWTEIQTLRRSTSASGDNGDILEVTIDDDKTCTLRRQYTVEESHDGCNTFTAASGVGNIDRWFVSPYYTHRLSEKYMTAMGYLGDLYIGSCQ